ncbi:MAG TPA: hypothetical protein VFG31_07630 [Conexibacter sp.]|nr:hypothetical protein [Conexibacter sp.]
MAGGGLRGWASSWGEEPDERARPLPCDALLPDAAIVVHRAVTIAADVPLVYRWVCQLRAAPWTPAGPQLLHGPLTTAFAVGDLAMARRQLLNLKALAERDARAVVSA